MEHSLKMIEGCPNGQTLHTFTSVRTNRIELFLGGVLISWKHSLTMYSFPGAHSDIGEGHSVVGLRFAPGQEDAPLVNAENIIHTTGELLAFWTRWLVSLAVGGSCTSPHNSLPLSRHSILYHVVVRSQRRHWAASLYTAVRAGLRDRSLQWPAVCPQQKVGPSLRQRAS